MKFILILEVEKMPIEIEGLICELNQKIYDLELKKRIRIYLPSEYKILDNEILRYKNIIKILENKFQES